MSPYSCPECHCVADVFGDHQVGCGGNGDRILRHNAIHDVIFCAAQSAALSPSKEVPNLILDSLSRPADVFLPTWWSCGRPAALDVHDISPLQQQTIAECLHSCHTCRWEYNGIWHPTSQLAVQQGLTSSPLWLRLWVVWRKTPSRSSEALVTSSVSVLDRAHPVLPHA